MIVRVAVLNKWDKTAENKTIKNIIRHDKYNEFSFEHDIALFELRKPFKLNTPAAVYPACLWQNPNIETTEADVAGWGATGSHMETDVLMKTTLHIQGMNCSAAFLYPFSNDLQICAGHPNRLTDACKGGERFSCYDGCYPFVTLYRFRRTTDDL